jgi:hypothetical protein
MEFLEIICRCTIPLCYIDDDEKLYHIGTGVLMKTGLNYYLLSAKHVFEDDKGVLNITTIEKIVYCKDDYVYPIKGRFVYFADEESIDILICKLEDDTVEEFSQFFEFFPSYLILQNTTLRYSSDYYIVGYPRGKVKWTYPYNKTFKRSQYIIQLPGLEEDDFNFNVEFHKNQLTNIDTGLRISAPDIKGMSGSGLWYKYQNNIYLVGIVHCFNNTASKISATKIDFVIDILNREFNDSYE